MSPALEHITEGLCQVVGDSIRSSQHGVLGISLGGDQAPTMIGSVLIKVFSGIRAK